MIFFELVASLFAYAEKQPILPQHQDIGIRGVVKRLNEIKAKKIKKLKAIRYRISLNSKTKNKKNPNEKIKKIKYKNDDLILVSLKIDKYNSNESPDVKVFNKNEIEKANNAYNEIEKDKTKEAVLLSVGHSQTLEKSYPNFFTDTRHFIKFVDKILYDYNKK